ncbi:hypothetical protein CJU89_1401 [Yarrowia sp. B02]|nr:hypothetical protein CJU89_1401 [Yarrowia sp. B02]
MSVERRILPLRPRRRASSKAIFNLPLILSTTTAPPEEEDTRLSFDHAGNWSEAPTRKIRSSHGDSEQTERKFASVGIQHDGLQLPPSRRSARVGFGQSSHLADLFEGQGYYEFDFMSKGSGVGQDSGPVKPSYKHAETQTPAENLPQVHVPQWTYSQRRVRFVNRSRRKYMKEKRKAKRAMGVENEGRSGYVCPFCEYEEVYKEPPYAWVSDYEMKEKEEWQRCKQKMNAGLNSDIHMFESSLHVFPDSYYEWESRPPDRGATSFSPSYGYSNDCYTNGG